MHLEWMQRTLHCTGSPNHPRFPHTLHGCMAALRQQTWDFSASAAKAAVRLTRSTLSARQPARQPTSRRIISRNTYAPILTDTISSKSIIGPLGHACGALQAYHRRPFYFQPESEGSPKPLYFRPLSQNLTACVAGNAFSSAGSALLGKVL